MHGNTNIDFSMLNGYHNGYAERFTSHGVCPQQKWTENGIWHAYKTQFSSNSLYMLKNSVEITYSCIFGMLHVLSNQYYFFSLTEGIVKAYVISFCCCLGFLFSIFKCNLYKKMDTETKYNLFWNVLWACVNCTFCKVQDDFLYIFSVLHLACNWVCAFWGWGIHFDNCSQWLKENISPQR